MKKLVLFTFMMMAAVLTYAQAPVTTTVSPVAKTNQSLAVFKWDQEVFDFGQIEQGTPVTHEFRFTNTGNVPLIISNVSTSCGCTVADYSREPIAPGKTGFIKSTYNAANPGAFHKSVTISANVEGGSVNLTIKGEVVVAK